MNKLMKKWWMRALVSFLILLAWANAVEIIEARMDWPSWASYPFMVLAGLPCGIWIGSAI